MKEYITAEKHPQEIPQTFNFSNDCPFTRITPQITTENPTIVATVNFSLNRIGDSAITITGRNNIKVTLYLHQFDHMLHKETSSLLPLLFLRYREKYRILIKRKPYHIITKELDVPAYRTLGLAMRDRKGASHAVKRFLDYLYCRKNP